MDNGQKTLSELFASSVFTVPVYQRAFAWDERQCEDFLRDLTEHPQGDPSKRHFLGTVLLAAKPPGDFRNRFDIVDGQQRLTTATIFAVVAIAKLIEDESLRVRGKLSGLPCFLVTEASDCSTRCQRTRDSWSGSFSKGRSQAIVISLPLLNAVSGARRRSSQKSSACWSQRMSIGY